jgi:hypothetical protein
MAIKIQKTTDIELNCVKSIVYGGPGTGKTRLCATMPTPIIVSAESGLLSLADVNVDFIEINSLRDWDETYRWAKSSAEAAQYESLCLDSLSEIAEVLVAELLPNYKDARQAYAQLANSMMPVLRKFRDLRNRHTLFTSKLIAIQDEESGVVTEQMLMPGKVLGTQIPYLVDEFFKLEVDRKNVATLQTAPSRLSFAKDRSGALDNPEKPDMSIIINKILLKRGV